MDHNPFHKIDVVADETLAFCVYELWMRHELGAGHEATRL